MGVIKIVEAIESMVNRRKLDKSFHRDEVERIFSSLLQGTDETDAYERRDAGIADEAWAKLVAGLNNYTKLTGEKNKDENIFDL